MTPLTKPNEPETSPSHPETSPPHPGDTTASLPPAPQAADPTFGPPVAPGELGRLGHYRVLRVLGRGGMGAIYLATDETLGREVALKVMLPSAAAVPTSRERFLREARAAAGIEHDNVVAIHHVGEESGVPYIVMPLLKGETLADRLKHEGRLTVAETLRVGREVALGLAAAHARGLVHRDVKPANIWLEAVTGRVKVLDFGLARPDDANRQHLTNSGAVVGTPAYMAPEQAAGIALDNRADLFSLGCVLYEAATGRRPFEAPTMMAVLTKIATHTPPPAATVADVPLALSDLITRLLAKHPEGRPATAAGVAELLRAPGGPESTVTQTHTPPLPRKPRRWAWAAAAVFSAMMAVLAGVIVLKVKRPDGSETTVEVPDGATAKVDAKGNVVVELLKAAPAAVAAVGLPGGRSPLDALERSAIPARELAIAGEGDPANAPAELVGIIGTSGMNHWRNVIYAGFRDGDKTLVTASRDGLVRWWDVPTKTLKRSVTVPGLVGCAWVTAGTFDLSPDGKLAAMLEETNKVVVRRTDTFAVVKEVPCLGSLEFSPDGRTLAIAGWNNSASQLLELESMALTVLDPIHSSGSDRLRSRPRFSPNSATLAYAEMDGKTSTWCIYNTLTGKKTREVKAMYGEWSLAWHPSGKVILGMTQDRTAIWNIDEDEVNTVSAVGAANGCTVTPDGYHVIGSGRGHIRVWEWGTWAKHDLRTGKSLDSAVNVVAICPTCRLIAVGDEGGGLCLVRFPGGESIQQANGRGNSIPVMISANGRRIYRAEGDFVTWHEELNQVMVERGRLEIGSECRNISFSRDGLRIAGVTGPNAVSLFAPGEFAITSKITVPGAHSAEQESMTFKGDALIVRRKDRSAVLVELPSGNQLIELPVPAVSEGDMDSIGSAVSPNGKLLVTVTNLPGKIRVWSRTSGKLVSELNPEPAGELLTNRRLYFSPDGNIMICISCRKTSPNLWTHGRFEVWDTLNWTKSLVLHKSDSFGGLGLAISPDSRQAAWPLSDGVIRLINLNTGNVERTIRVGPVGGAIANCAYAPDGRHIVTANANGTSYVFRLASASPVKTGQFPSLDPVWASKVRRLSRQAQLPELLAELKRRNPAFEGRVELHPDADPADDPAYVGALVIDADQLEDITPLSLFSRYSHLCLGATSPVYGILRDITPLAKVNSIGILTLGFQSFLNDLSPLRGVKIDIFWAPDTGLRNLDSLNDSHVKHLNIGGTPIMSLPNWQSLRVLSAYMCPNLSSLHPISNSKIIKLDLGRSTDLADLTPIKNLPLEWIAFRYDEGLRVEDAKVLRTMKTLKTINHKLTTDFWTSYDLAN